jgi:hypothetical protein
MVTKCNVESIKNLIDDIVEGKIGQLTIEERIDTAHKGEYNAEVTYLDTQVKVDLEFRMHTADVLNEFSSMLEKKKVQRFFMHFDIDGKKCNVSKAFTNNEVSLSATSDNNVAEDLGTLLNKAIALLGDAADKTVPELTRKIKRENGQKPLFKEVKVAEALDYVLKVVKADE